jgi:hypothetical protein
MTLDDHTVHQWAEGAMNNPRESRPGQHTVAMAFMAFWQAGDDRYFHFYRNQPQEGTVVSVTLLSGNYAQ